MIAAFIIVIAIIIGIGLYHLGKKRGKTFLLIKKFIIVL